MSKIIRFFYLILFFFTPLIFTSFNSELFELPKMYFVYLLTLIILTLHLLNFFNRKTNLFHHTFLDISLIIFLLSQTMSTVFSIDPHTSFFGYYSRLNGGLLSTVCYIVLYWILVVYIDDKFKKNIISFSLFSGLLVALFGITEHFGIDKHIWVQDVQSRVFSTLGQPNWLAAYLCILLPFFLSNFLNSLYSYGRSALRPYIYFLLTIIFYLCLLFTKSKSGIIAAIISLSIFFIIYFFQNLNLKKTSLFKGGCPAAAGQVGLIIILFTTLSLTINNPIKDKIFPQKSDISNLISENLKSDILITPSEDIRKIVWKGSIDLWKKFPFFGTGVETFAYSYYWTRPIEHNLTSEWDFLYNKAHNEYLNYLATTGIFGLLSYLSIIFCVLYFILKKIPNTKYHILNTILCSYISILITNFAGFSVVVIALYFFLLPALLIDNKNQPEIKNKNNTPKIFSVILIILFFIFFQKIISYYLADIHYTKADNFDSQNNYQSAYDEIKISLNYRNNEPFYLNKISSLAAKLAIVANSKENIDLTNQFIEESINYSNQAVKISPANTSIWKERSQTFYYLSSIDLKYFENTIKSLLTVTTLAPTDAKTYYLIGKFFEAINSQKNALPYFEKAVSLKPNYDYALFELGKIYFAKKDYEKAKISFEKVLEIAPTNQDAKDYLKKIKNIL